MVAVDAAQQGRVITLEELEQHNKEDDLWIAVDGKVYDMTKYHKVHPGFGGPAIIVKNAGMDASAGFRKAKHSPKAKEIQGGLLIGELERNVKSELAKVIMKKVNETSDTRVMCQVCGNRNCIWKWRCYKCKNRSYKCTCKKPDS